MLAKSIPRNLFLGSINVYKYGLRLHRLAESIPWNLFPGFLNIYRFGLWELFCLSISCRSTDVSHMVTRIITCRYLFTDRTVGTNLKINIRWLTITALYKRLQSFHGTLIYVFDVHAIIQHLICHTIAASFISSWAEGINSKLRIIILSHVIQSSSQLMIQYIMTEIKSLFFQVFFFFFNQFFPL
jgi:hypothetical protein